MQLQKSFGYSNYHSLQFQVGRQYANGLQFNAHYTWSKSLDFTQTEAATNGFADTGGYDIGKRQPGVYLSQPGAKMEIPDSGSP
jgi:hypothetical protein